MDTSLIPQLNGYVEIGEVDVTKTATWKTNQADFAVIVSLWSFREKIDIRA